MLIHDFYLIELNSIKILKSLDIYSSILDIDRKVEKNGFNGINLIEKIHINDDFITFILDLLKITPNDTQEKIQIKSNFELNYYGITILKDSEKIYNIFNDIYCIFEQLEDIFYMQKIYINGICCNTKIISEERYNILYNKKSCEKILKKDIIYIFNKLKDFSLKLKNDNYYIIHCGI